MFLKLFKINAILGLYTITASKDRNLVYVSMTGRQVAASFQISLAHPFRYTVATNNCIILKCSAIADDCRVHPAKE
jgi:hypothetical protein